MPTFRGLRRLTLTQQWLVATLLALLPLLLAVIYAISSLTEQTREHRRLLLSTSQLKDLEASIAQQIGGLERANMQYLLLGDEGFNDLYQERLQNLSDYQQEMAELLPNGPEQEAFDNLFQQLTTPPTQSGDEGATDAAGAYWQAIRRKREDLQQRIDTFTEESIEQDEANYSMDLRRIIVIVSLAIPGSVLLLILTTVAVARPWWRLVNTIRRLGEQEWQHPVHIDGPADFVELGNNLEWMRKQLLAIERQKQTFSQHVTHELKSPLAAIIEAESLLRDELPGRINDSQRKVLDILRVNAANLSELIQQFLNYNTVLNNLSPALTTVDVKAIYDKAHWHLTNANPGKHINWQWRGASHQIVSDPFCMQMIISNLLSNAARMVPDHGCVQVSLDTESSNWHLVVQDSGPGIPRCEREKIFKPFYQGEQPQRASLQGNGIGLSIVKECVQRLGGTITIDTSTLGGALFSLHFPQAKSTEVGYVETAYSTG